MDNLPVARRTRLREKLERERRLSILKKDFEDLYIKRKTNLELLCHGMKSIEIQATRYRRAIARKICLRRLGVIIRGQDLKARAYRLDRKLKDVVKSIKIAQNEVFNLKQISNVLLIEPLHAHGCNESEECLALMHRTLKNDPLKLEQKTTLERINYIPTVNFHVRYSPLQHAVRKHHVRCVKFLLERGANVTSLSTFEDGTVLHTLYYEHNCKFDGTRIDILKLLLKYGVSQVFDYNEAGLFALLRSISLYAYEEVVLLLNHGATLNKKQLRQTMFDAWVCLNTQQMKILLVNYPKKLNFSRNAYIYCKYLFPIAYKRMLISGVPSDIYIEKMIQFLIFFRKVVGHIPGWQWKEILECLKSYKHRRHFRENKLKIKAVFTNPLTLQELARVAIRKSIRNCYWKNMQELGLPDAIESFLTYNDVTNAGFLRVYPDDPHINDNESSSGSDGKSEHEY